jgi:hypothetical protein
MKRLSTFAHRGSIFSVFAFFALSMISPLGFAQGGAQSAGNGNGQQSATAENECVRYLEKTRAPQYHNSINVLKPNVIVGPLGTEVLIPENAFVTEDGKPVTGEVVINFSEYINKSDLILSNLPTVSNGRMLETGGVIFLEALSNGEKLKLAQGKSVLVNFPGGAQEGMRLFTGKYDASGKLNWVTMSDQPEHFTQPLAQRQTAKTGAFPLNFEYGTASATTFQFKKNPELNVQAYVYAMMEQHYNCRGRDQIYVEIKLNENGRTEKVRTTSGKNACMRLAVEEIMQTIPWETSEMNGDQIYLNLEPDISAPAGESENMFVSLAGQQLTVGKGEIENIMAEYVEKDRAKNFVKNAFTVSQLGYINCDRFMAENTPMVAATINFNRKELTNNAKVFMVFDDINSVMEASPAGYGEFRFANVPSGRSVTIVAVAYEPNVGPYLSIQKAIVSEGNLGKMKMEKSNDNAVKQTLASL